MLDKIQNCYSSGKILFSKHARNEMDNEEFGVILEREVNQAVMSDKIIEEYHDDEPYPSCLIYGKTKEERPLHIVCAYASEDNLIIIITVYQPDPAKWINYERRKI
ncbi:MAG: DUF4258 domain-containing protein [Ignavibacteria bacterium]